MFFYPRAYIMKTTHSKLLRARNCSSVCGKNKCYTHIIHS